jgi:predicted RNA binding protein YcfA (HicA-like mRNA interferase family)
VKRRYLVRHLEAHGCQLFREGAKHSVFVNRRTRKASTVPRHREINEHLARKICRDLEVPSPAA